MESNRPVFCSVVDAGRLLGVSRSLTYELLSAGSLRSVKLGKRRLVEIASIDEFAASLPIIALKQSPVSSEANHA